jgi:hypothetical protein
MHEVPQDKDAALAAYDQAVGSGDADVATEAR